MQYVEAHLLEWHETWMGIHEPKKRQRKEKPPKLLKRIQRLKATIYSIIANKSQGIHIHSI